MKKTSYGKESDLQKSVRFRKPSCIVQKFVFVSAKA
jgi:hypothetical protein